MDIKNYPFQDETWNPEDFSKEFAEFQKESSEELECGRTYKSIVELFVKRYTSKMKTPMFSIGVRTENGTLANIDFILDKENREFMNRTFKDLKKALKALDFNLENLTNLDLLVTECNKNLLGKEIYIKPYERNGFTNYEVVNPLYQ